MSSPAPEPGLIWKKVLPRSPLVTKPLRSEPCKYLILMLACTRSQLQDQLACNTAELEGKAVAMAALEGRLAEEEEEKRNALTSVMRLEAQVMNRRTHDENALGESRSVRRLVRCFALLMSHLLFVLAGQEPQTRAAPATKSTRRGAREYHHLGSPAGGPGGRTASRRKSSKWKTCESAVSYGSLLCSRASPKFRLRYAATSMFTILLIRCFQLRLGPPQRVAIRTSFLSGIVFASLTNHVTGSVCCFCFDYRSHQKALRIPLTRASTPLAHTFRWDGRKKNKLHEVAPHRMGRASRRLERVGRIVGEVSARASAVCQARETR